MKRLALLVLPVALLALSSSPASGTQRNGEADERIFLTIKEAKAAILRRIRREETGQGNLTSLVVRDCQRQSRRRVICYTFRRVEPNYYCEGHIGARETPGGYRTRDLNVSCYDL